ncbi:hypothetical protein BIY22_02195 [Vibrio panuliri]|uniref:Right handed beta helix domain-containing protein n=1 Tax=Vibrio panuliri TaxID=1381081 RepID=A0A1Q9HR53_9VIBR|nr:hypothetical protein [Vibrio panuliri]OLQ93323.1 hypothetical protein BIY22_02195 [Vibrio panuliri]
MNKLNHFIATKHGKARAVSFLLTMIFMFSAASVSHSSEVDNLASATNNISYRITPLLESASISIFDRSESDTASIQYRKKGDENWRDGLDLHWNSHDNALSGSIFYLKEQTEYEVKVTLRSDVQDDEIQIYSFKTWDSQPQFDPQKIYHLKDIYFGGQLDLEALNIEGTSDGWAKIIGDDTTPIVADSNVHDSAINIGSNKYIYFENITVSGGRKNAISSDSSHNLWFNGCNISGFGRSPNVIVDGLAYENADDRTPINYDSAFNLYNTGVVVVENCHVHSPVPKANNWSAGHPHGPNAYLAAANHPDWNYSGQVILRNNRFYGTHGHRFNDVIESRSNGSILGGFVRDSAIYNNYLAYSNDDIIEMDGGQNNVSFYDNEIEHGYVGVSVIPNVKGPSYVFNNYIHDLGDDRGKKWGAIKVGGLVTRPEGVTNVLNNYIRTGANGITASGYAGDKTYWVNVINNVMIHDMYRQYRGYSIYDHEFYAKSQFINNYMFNLVVEKSVYQAENVVPFYDSSLVNTEFATSLWESDKSYVTFDMPTNHHVANITKFDNTGKTIIGLYPLSANTNTFLPIANHRGESFNYSQVINNFLDKAGSRNLTDTDIGRNNKGIFYFDIQTYICKGFWSCLLPPY